MKLPKLGINKYKPSNLKLRLRILVYIFTLLFSILSLTETKQSYLGSIVDMIIYVISACGVALSVYYLSYDITVGFKTTIHAVTEKYTLAGRVYKDYHYRTVLFTTFSFLLNMLYAVGNGVYGFRNQSAWMGTMAIYYMFLSVMRFGVVWYSRKISKEAMKWNLKLRERMIYRNTGILLILITIVLNGMVILLLHNLGGKSYPGTLIFAVAAYTFYKIIISVVHLFKAKRMKSQLLVTIRNIGYADALVSVLFLQTAMFSSFGVNTGMNQQLMNVATGMAVCIIITFIGSYMIYSFGRQKKKLLQAENKEKL